MPSPTCRTVPTLETFTSWSYCSICWRIMLLISSGLIAAMLVFMCQLSVVSCQLSVDVFGKKELGFCNKHLRITARKQKLIYSYFLFDSSLGLSSFFLLSVTSLTSRTLLVAELPASLNQEFKRIPRRRNCPRRLASIT